MPKISRHSFYHSTILTDWSGQLLSKKALKLLRPDCLVRVCIQDTNSPCMEAIYAKITKIKDGSVWGTIQGTYRQDHDFLKPTGSQIVFRLTDITEIPITWQPKRIQRHMEQLLDTRRIGRCITGCF